MNPELSNAQIRTILASVLWQTRKLPRPKWTERTVITRKQLAYWAAQSILRDIYFDLSKS
jgi:hypothetical protein